jgi:hypothetical protein
VQEKLFAAEDSEIAVADGKGPKKSRSVSSHIEKIKGNGSLSKKSTIKENENGEEEEIMSKASVKSKLNSFFKRVV